MKKQRYFHSLILIGILYPFLWGCSDEKEPDPDVVSEIKDELIFASTNPQTITFTTNKAWSASLSSPDGNTSWCKVLPMNGEAGTVNMTVNTTENTGYDDRTVELTIKTGNTTKTVTITQKQKDAIILSKNNYEIPEEGGTFEIEANTNVELEVFIPEEVTWLHLQTSGTRALSTKKITFVVDKNTDSKIRTATIIVKDKNSALSSEITVTQQAKKVVARSVQVDTPGTLRELLGAEFKDVEELTITGKINGNDIETLRLIYHLQYLDISDVFILDGGGYFPYGSWGESERTVANTISADMFRYYDELHTIILPNSVISIGQSAFEGCTGLTSITLPNSVTTIGYRAFRSCTGLTSISIGSGIKEIGGSAFENCNNIKEIHIRAVTPPYGSGGMPYKSTIKLYIPKGSKEAYEKVWDWEGFYQYIEE